MLSATSGKEKSDNFVNYNTKHKYYPIRKYNLLQDKGLLKI